MLRLPNAKKATEIVELLNTLIMNQPIQKESVSPSLFTCPHCRVVQQREGMFCSYCGKPVPVVPSIVRNTEHNDESSELMSVCSICGNRQASGKKFCAYCGHPMEVQSPPKRVCPGCSAKIESKVLFCMECGMKL